MFKLNTNMMRTNQMTHMISLKKDSNLKTLVMKSNTLTIQKFLKNRLYRFKMTSSRIDQQNAARTIKINLIKTQMDSWVRKAKTMISSFRKIVNKKKTTATILTNIRIDLKTN